MTTDNNTNPVVKESLTTQKEEMKQAQKHRFPCPLCLGKGYHEVEGLGGQQTVESQEGHLALEACKLVEQDLQKLQSENDQLKNQVEEEKSWAVHYSDKLEEEREFFELESQKCEQLKKENDQLKKELSEEQKKVSREIIELQAVIDECWLVLDDCEHVDTSGGEYNPKCPSCDTTMSLTPNKGHKEHCALKKVLNAIQSLKLKGK